MRPTTESIEMSPLTETATFNEGQEKTALLSLRANVQEAHLALGASLEKLPSYQTFEIEDGATRTPSRCRALAQSLRAWCAQDPQNMLLKLGGTAACFVVFVLLFYLIEYLSQLDNASSEPLSTFTPRTSFFPSTSGRTSFLSSLSTTEDGSTTVATTITKSSTVLMSTWFSSASTSGSTPDPRCVIPNKDCCDHGRWVC